MHDLPAVQQGARLMAGHARSLQVHLAHLAPRHLCLKPSAERGVRGVSSGHADRNSQKVVRGTLPRRAFTVVTVPKKKKKKKKNPTHFSSHHSIIRNQDRTSPREPRIQPPVPSHPIPWFPLASPRLASPRLCRAYYAFAIRATPVMMAHLHALHAPASRPVVDSTIQPRWGRGTGASSGWQCNTGDDIPKSEMLVFFQVLPINRARVVIHATHIS